MQLVTYRIGERTAAGRIEGDDVVLLPFRDVGTLLSSDDWQAAAAAQGERMLFDPNQLAPLIPRPPKIWCVGLNYAAHVAEMGYPTPTYPTLFAKFPISLIGAHDDIKLPGASSEVDWEAELGVVVGRSGRHVTAGDAHHYIAGFCVVNDISVRDWQLRTAQYLQGKTFEATTPLGPALVTPDAVADPKTGLRISCRVNETIVQSASTDDLIFSVDELVAYVSSIASLEPGDVIVTGTPGGVGAGRKPPIYLRPGDVVETVVEGIGTLVNTCVAAEAPKK